jgi:hypothetical protein
MAAGVSDFNFYCLVYNHEQDSYNFLHPLLPVAASILPGRLVLEHFPIRLTPPRFTSPRRAWLSLRLAERGRPRMSLPDKRAFRADIPVPLAPVAASRR